MALPLSRKEALLIGLSPILAACADTTPAAQPTPLATSLAKEPEKPKELERPIEPGWSRFHSNNYPYLIDYPGHWSATSYPPHPTTGILLDYLVGQTKDRRGIHITIDSKLVDPNVTFDTYVRQQLEQERRKRGWSSEDFEKVLRFTYEDAMKIGPTFMSGKKVPTMAIMTIEDMFPNRIEFIEAAFIFRGQLWRVAYDGLLFAQDGFLDEFSRNLFSKKILPSMRLIE